MCQAFQIPPLVDKHHIVRITAIQDDMQYLNSIKLYVCSEGAGIADGNTWECTRDPMGQMEQGARKVASACTAVMFAWSLGQSEGSLLVPESAGFPINDPLIDDRYAIKLLVMQANFDNPSSLRTLSSSAGVRIHYTPELRCVVVVRVVVVRVVVVRVVVVVAIIAIVICIIHTHYKPANSAMHLGIV
jgi:hypothetical protein